MKKFLNEADPVALILGFGTFIYVLVALLILLIKGKL